LILDTKFYFSPLSQGVVAQALAHSQEFIRQTLKSVDGIERGDGLAVL